MIRHAWRVWVAAWRVILHPLVWSGQWIARNLRRE